MLSTPASLLERLARPNDSSAWDNFVDLYSPLLYHWAKRLGLQNSDAADLVQDVFFLLFRKLGSFSYDPSRSFHAWLRAIFLNQHRARLRKRDHVPVDGSLAEVPDRETEPFEDGEYRRYLIQRGFRLVEREFNSVQCEAFRQYVLAERSPEEVAQELGLSPGSIYSIKSKILSRLRHELVHFID